MNRNEALQTLADGHGLISVEAAQEVCAEIGLEFDDSLVMRWEGQADANPTNNPKGLWLYEDKPGEGVPTGSLSGYVAGQFGLDVQSFMGRGFQARANAVAIRKHLALEEEGIYVECNRGVRCTCLLQSLED